MSDGCSLNQSFGLREKKNWHVIKSDPDILETKSCPLPCTSVESRLVLKCKDIQTTTSKFKVVRLLRSFVSVIFESLRQGQEILAQKDELMQLIIMNRFM